MRKEFSAAWGPRAGRAGLMGAVLLLSALVVPSSGRGEAPAVDTATAPHRLVLRTGSRLWLEGGSNLHDWSCDAGRLATEIHLEAREEGEDVPSPTAVDRVLVRVPVGQIVCGNGTMEGKLRDALKADRFGEIVFSMTSAEMVREVVDGMFAVRARGTLTVAGVARPLVLDVTGSDTGDGGLRIQGRVPLRMTDFGVEPPTALLGVLKTHDELIVLFDLSADYEEIAAGIDNGGRRP